MAICCQLFCYMCMFIRFLVLWVVELIYRCGGEKECFVWSIKWLFPSLPPLLSTVYQCDRCLWLGCQVLPAFDAVSILEFASKLLWKLQGVPGTQPPCSDAVVNLCLTIFLFLLAGNSWLEKLSSHLPYWHSDPKLSYYNSCGIHSSMPDDHTALC